jgi:hypothetical protein
MTLDENIGNARSLLQTDSLGLTGTDAITLANEAQFGVIADLIKKGINAAQLQESYEDASDLVGRYLWPSDLWLPKEVMVNYIDSTQGNYREVDIMDAGNLPDGTSIQQIRANQSKADPVIMNNGDWFEVFPAPNNSVNKDNLTQFFRIIYFLAPVKFVSAAGDGTDVAVPYPLSLSPWLLAYRMAWIQALRGNEEMKTRADGYEKNYLTTLDTIEAIIRKPTQKPLVATGIVITGREF